MLRDEEPPHKSGPAPVSSDVPQSPDKSVRLKSWPTLGQAARRQFLGGGERLVRPSVGYRVGIRVSDLLQEALQVAVVRLVHDLAHNACKTTAGHKDHRVG